MRFKYFPTHLVPHFTPQQRKKVKNQLLRLAAIGIFLDALTVFGVKTILFLEPAFFHACCHAAGSFGSTCGAFACLIEETHEFIDQ